MLLESLSSVLQSSAALFAIGFVVLFLIYYFTSPIYTEYGGKRSRLYYSLINALYFSLVLAVLYAVLPSLSNAYGVLVGLAVGLAIIFIFTLAHVYTITTLVRRGLLRIRQKKRSAK